MFAGLSLGDDRARQPVSQTRLVFPGLDGEPDLLQPLMLGDFNFDLPAARLLPVPMDLDLDVLVSALLDQPASTSSGRSTGSVRLFSQIGEDNPIGLETWVQLPVTHRNDHEVRRPELEEDTFVAPVLDEYHQARVRREFEQAQERVRRDRERSAARQRQRRRQERERREGMFCSPYGEYTHVSGEPFSFCFWVTLPIFFRGGDAVCFCVRMHHNHFRIVAFFWRECGCPVILSVSTWFFFVCVEILLVHLGPALIDVQQHSVGPLNRTCPYCKALLFTLEPEGMCCMKGAVELPPLERPPPELWMMLKDKGTLGRHYRNCIRQYNAAFNMASTTARVDRPFPDGIQALRINGLVHQPAPFILLGMGAGLRWSFVLFLFSIFS